ncbi:hypothetical protein [Qipengyuania citrea]|uniref:hypothetical protein n=1 Tax=Qipengyuania citrea TaxID=225971 RepID=UPI0032998127
MANNYLQAAFAVTVTAAEARLIAAVENAVEALDQGLEGEDRQAAFDALGPAFAEAFPPGEDDPFAAVLAIFPDANFPYLDATISFDEEDDDRKTVSFTGDQFGIEQIANLLFACAKSALPLGFEYAYTCDRLRHDEFGGGAVVITETGIRYRSTSDIVREALAARSDEGANGYVLATRDAEHGLSFWNTEEGFGRLATATVFSEREAAEYDKPIADDEPEWLACPADNL